MLLSYCGYRYWEPVDQASMPLWLLTGASSQTIEMPVCMDAATREQVKAVMYDALDEALKDHIKHVFEIWLKDERGQPGRAKTGVEIGVRAYINAKRGVGDWAPPLCGG